MFVSILPEWACFILTLIFVLFSHEVGYRLGFKKSLKAGENPSEAAGALSGTATVMLAFLLAFAFNGAASHNQLRKDLVIEEANAIRTTYQQSMGLPDPYRARIRDLLREYVDIRVNLGQIHGQLRKVDLGRAITRTLAIQDDLWSLALVLQKKESSAPMVSAYTQSLGTVFDLHVQRFNAAFRTRLPPVVWAVLYLLAFITMAMIGYRVGLSGARSTFIEVGIALAFSLVLFLITSLDRTSGILRATQQPLIDLLSMIRGGG